MKDLFEDQHPMHLLDLPNSDIRYYPNFLENNEASRYFKIILEETSWRQDNITLFGKTHPQPRLTALYGNNGKSYSYSKIVMEPEPFTFALSEIKKKVEIISQQTFTSCLLNLYRDGKDSNGWHSDDEKELGKNPIIASVSLGADRVFKFRDKRVTSNTFKLLLEHGSLLLMKGSTQHYWQHQLPKTSKKVEARINLTFRTILG